jgi:hypothetical protein
MVSTANVAIAIKTKPDIYHIAVFTEAISANLGSMVVKKDQFCSHNLGFLFF